MYSSLFGLRNQMNDMMTEMNRVFNDPFFRVGADDMMFEPLFMPSNQQLLTPGTQQQQQLQSGGGGMIPSKESGADTSALSASPAGPSDLTSTTGQQLGQSRGRQWWPAAQHMRCDVHEDKDKYTVTAELPGVAKDEVRVSLDNGLLTISGDKKEEKVDESDRGGRHLRRAERRYGSFSRSFRLPTASEADKVSAKFEHGVLSLIIPKIEPKQDLSKFVNVQ